MKRKSRFTRGSGCYTCRACGKRTRETGEGESSIELCIRCYDDAGLENNHSDGGHDDNPHPDCYLCQGRPANWDREKGGNK